MALSPRTIRQYISKKFGNPVIEVPDIGRIEKILSHIDRKGRGLEIGAGFAPAAPRSQGFNVEVLDHTTTQGLRDKYANDPTVDISKIENIDYVWSGEPYHELIGEQECFDFVIASHVVEHTPNLVFFLQEIETILKPGGILSLAVPYKERCFDYLRPISTTGQVLQAHIDNRKFHTPGTLFDNVSLSVSMNGATGWGDENVENLKLYHEDTLHKAAGRLEKGKAQDSYFDAHAWCFTPSSFRLIINDLRILEYTTLSECGAFPPNHCEFFIALKKGGEPPNTDRLALAVAAAKGE